jgi:hypothetical protein
MWFESLIISIILVVAFYTFIGRICVQINISKDFNQKCEEKTTKRVLSESFSFDGELIKKKPKTEKKSKSNEPKRTEPILSPVLEEPSESTSVSENNSINNSTSESDFKPLAALIDSK